MADQHAGHDQRVAEDHHDDEPRRQMALIAEGDVDADQQRLVRERIEIAANHRARLKVLGQEPVHRVGDAGAHEQPEGGGELAVDDQVDRHRHGA